LLEEKHDIYHVFNDFYYLIFINVALSSVTKPKKHDIYHVFLLT